MSPDFDVFVEPWDCLGYDWSAEPASEHPTRFVVEVLAFQALPPGSDASQRALVRWSDGTEGEAARWYDDEAVVSERDLIGETEAEIGTLVRRRDRDYLSE